MGGTWLEIAPYFYPLLDRAKHDVRYVDCIDNDTIAKKAAENPGAIGRKIPHIDWVWTQGKTLRSCIPADTMFDYGVATHVMEHVPDTVGWLNQILEVMRDGAVRSRCPTGDTRWITIARRRHLATWWETGCMRRVGLPAHRSSISSHNRSTTRAKVAEGSTSTSPPRPRRT